MLRASGILLIFNFLTWTKVKQVSNLQFIKLHIYALCTFPYICNIPDKRGLKNDN